MSCLGLIKKRLFQKLFKKIFFNNLFEVNKQSELFVVKKISTPLVNYPNNISFATAIVFEIG